METTVSGRVAASAGLLAAFDAVRGLELPIGAAPAREAALEVGDIVRMLDADDVVVVAALLQPLLDGRYIERETAEKRFGDEPVRLARSLSQLGEFGLPPDWTPERGLESGQAESLRKMLLAVIGDVRLVVVRLAEQLQKMRSAKSLDAVIQRKLAIETREVYAPLANRLGVWQVKWELEDLAFRYLEPAQYKHIAAALKVRRAERERYMDELRAQLKSELHMAGIEAAIEGRPKHIYSIWRKMQAKRLAFDQLMDIRAARVLVDTVAECYAALGVVHSLWQFIPGEFDDYIATPKDNFYRSIHTAVIGPGGQPVEIQIRTHEMHANSERGVAAHWRYKEGGRERSGLRAEDQSAALAAGTHRRRRDTERLPRSHARRPVPGSGLCRLTQGRDRRCAGRRHAARLRLPGAHGLRSPNPRRQGQRPHGVLGLYAQEQRHRGDHHRQVRAAVPGLVVAPIRFSCEPASSQQSARMVSQAGRDPEQGRGTSAVRSGNAAAGCT